MEITSSYTLIPYRTAALTAPLIERLIQKYGISPAQFDVEGVQGLNRYWSEVTAKADLLTEWVLKSVGQGSGRPEDVPRFRSAATFFFEVWKTPKFKNVVQEYSQEHGKIFNPKNILDFTLHEVEDIQELYNQPAVDPRVYELSGKLPEGSGLFYNDGTYQIVEVTSSQAACQLSRGSKWCTSDEEVAGQYLDSSPLYIIYVNGKKTAQMHIGDLDIQLMDLRDREIIPDANLRTALIQSGLFNYILRGLDQDRDGDTRPDAEFSRWLGGDRLPEVEGVIAKYPYVSYIYARDNLQSRFPEAEAAIAADPFVAYLYAGEVVKGRFPTGEPAIMESRYLGNYVTILQLRNDKFQTLRSFLRDYHDWKVLDRYRGIPFPGYIHHDGQEYRKTGSGKRDENGNYIMEYLTPSGEERYLWADDQGRVVRDGRG